MFAGERNRWSAMLNAIADVNMILLKRGSWPVRGNCDVAAYSEDVISIANTLAPDQTENTRQHIRVDQYFGVNRGLLPTDKIY